MKNIRRLVCLTSFMYGFIGASSDQELFLHANKEYDYKNFAQSLESYKSMHTKGQAVWYNMGNCAYQLGNYIDAYIYWQRAQRNATAAELADIRYNIQALNTKLGISQEVTWRQRVSSFLYDCTCSISCIVLQLLLLFGWFFTCLLIRYYRQYKNFGVMLTTLLIINIPLALLLANKYVYQEQHIGIVAHKNVSLYAGPHEQYHFIGSVDQLAQVSVQELRDSWCKIKHQQLVGWVPLDKIVLI